MTAPALAPCNAMWIGPSMGPIERACLRSVMRQGHKLVLWCYEPPEGAPEGAELGDAAEIVPRDQIIRYRSGSVALFSNRFRYELQRLGRGIWIDTDQYLIAPITFDRPYIFGWQDRRSFNTGVLKIPCESPMLPDLLRPFEQKEVPSWMPPLSRLRAEAERARTGRVDVTRLPWGTTGPKALTAIAHKHAVADQALPPSVFYPVHYKKAKWLLNPKLGIDDVVAHDTLGVHLWNELIKHFKNDPAPRGSFLAQLQREGA